MTSLELLENLGRRLEPDAAQRKELLAKAESYIEQFIRSLPSAKGYSGGGIQRLRELEVGEPKSFDRLLEIIREEVDGPGINSASGRHLGYIPGGGLYASALADMIVAISNRYAGVAFSSPGAVEIENQMIRWMMSVVGYPDEGYGNLTSGGSIANLIAIKAARDFHAIGSANVKTSVIYFTDHVHHCIHKALHMTGLYEAVLRRIAMNENHQMDTRDLRRQVELDIKAGLKPFLVVASAGTTDTGAIDPLQEISSICKTHEIWFHVDAAYGGFFLLLEEMKGKFAGIEASDSIVIDPHKTLFIPYGSGIVLLRNKNALLDSYSHEAAYMMDAYGREQIDPADTGPELSRHFRGMRMWLPLHLHGLAPFRACLEEKILLCRYFHDEVQALGFETGPYPQLTVAIFRLPDDADNRKNERLMRALHQDGSVFFSSTMINGTFWIRCAVVHFRTHLDEIKIALNMVSTISGIVRMQT